jgi:hypothetical protein
VLHQDAVDRRPQPHQPAAQRERVDLERLDDIVGSGHVVVGQVHSLR